VKTPTVPQNYCLSNCDQNRACC